MVSLENSARKKFPSSHSFQESEHSVTSHDQDTESGMIFKYLNIFKALFFLII